MLERSTGALGGRRVIVDRGTGSTWDVLGQATAGPLADRRLEAVVHGAHFWFAIAAFVPEARIWSP